MADSLANALKNLIAQELEKRGVTSPPPSSNQDILIDVSEIPDDVPPTPSSANDAATELPNPNVPEPVVEHPNYQVEEFQKPPLGTPDVSSFTVTQTLISPTNSSDIASVAVLIEFPDIYGASDYKIRWVTA